MDKCIETIPGTKQNEDDKTIAEKLNVSEKSLQVYKEDLWQCIEASFKTQWESPDK